MTTCIVAELLAMGCSMAVDEVPASASMREHVPLALRMFVDGSCASLLLAACAASKPTAVTQPTVDGKLAALDFFVGAWRAEAENPTNGERFTLDYTVAPLPGGQWYLGTGHAAKLGLHIHDVWGIDPINGDITRTIFDSQQTTGTVRAKGWSGDTLVLEGDARAKAGVVAVRETITKVSADELKAVWQMKTGDTWTPYSIETLRRL